MIEMMAFTVVVLEMSFDLYLGCEMVEAFFLPPPLLCGGTPGLVITDAFFTSPFTSVEACESPFKSAWRFNCQLLLS